MNENENNITIWYAAKEVLGDAKHVKKQERFQISDLSLLPKRLEKEKLKPK